MEVKRGPRKSILQLTDDGWTWNRAQQSRVHAAEITYVRGACRMTRWEGKSTGTVYEKLCKWCEVCGD